MNLRLPLALLLVPCALATAAHEGEPEVRRAEEIVVEEQAEKALEPFDSAPVETEVLNQKEIEERPATTADQLVNRLPGIRTQQRIQGEEAAVSIEGLPPEFTRALVDGRRYTGEIGGVDDLRDLPLSDVERVEVVRGAQGLRFGSEAAGGVVRVITADPPVDGWRANADVGGGSDTHVLSAGAVAAGSETLGGSLRFVREQIDGYDTPGGVDAVVLGSGSDSRSTSNDVYATLVTRPFANVELQTRGGWREENDDLSAIADLPSGHSDTTRWLASQDVVWTLGEYTRVESGLSYYRNAIDADSARRFTLDEDEWGVNGSVERVFEIGPVLTTLLVGTDLRRPTLDLNEGPLPPDVEIPGWVPGDVHEHSGQAGFFWIAETDFTSWLTLETGFRAQLQTDFAPAYLPQAALMATAWEPGDGRLLRLRASWGKSYRTPSLRDRYQPPVPQLGGAYFLEGNEALDPESLQSWRLGFELVPNRWLGLSVTGFYNDITDHIRSSYAGNVKIGEREVYVPPPPLDPDLELICEAVDYFYAECNPEGGFDVVDVTSPLYRKQNLDDVKTRGVEVRARLRPHRLLAIDVGYTFLDTHVKDTNVSISELPNEAPNTVDTLVSLTLPRVDTTLTVQTRWRDRALTETSGTGGLGFGSTEKSDPSLQVDLRVLQPISERFALYADFYNLTDNRVVDSYVVRGRSFFGGVRASFSGAELW